MSQPPLIKGLAFVLADDVNTDIHCSNKYLPGKGPDYVAAHAFEQLDPGLASEISRHGGGILVAGEHFGINSSREQAVQVMQIMNVRAIVAKSFGRQFFRNAINNGMPVFECDTGRIVAGEPLTLDLTAGLIRLGGGAEIATQPLPPEILAILSVGGLIPFLQRYPDWRFA